MTIREASLADEDFIVGLVPRFVEHGAADGHPPQEVIEGTTRVLREALHNPQPGELILVAHDERGEPAGFVYAVTECDFFTGEEYAHVSEIATARSGAGTGAALMDAVERWSRESGHRMLSLNVVDENTAAQRFYERRGYTLGHHHYVKRLR